MAEDVIRGVTRMCGECMEDRLKDVREQIEQLVASDKDKSAQIEKLTETVRDLNDKKRKNDSVVSAEHVEKLAAEVKDTKERMQQLSVSMSDIKAQLARVTADMPQTLAQLQQEFQRLAQNVNQVVTPQYHQLAQQVTAMAPQVQQLVAQTGQSQGQMAKIAADVTQAITTLKAQGPAGGSPHLGGDPHLAQNVQAAVTLCQNLQAQLPGYAKEEQVSQAFARVDQAIAQAHNALAWQDMNPDNPEMFDAGKSYRLQSSDGWMYSTLVQPNCVYMVSVANADEVVVLFAQNKRLPMSRPVGSAIETMTAFPSGRLQYRS